jgi:hypothetical protein
MLSKPQGIVRPEGLDKLKINSMIHRGSNRRPSGSIIRRNEGRFTSMALVYRSVCVRTRCAGTCGSLHSIAAWSPCCLLLTLKTVARSPWAVDLHATRLLPTRGIHFSSGIRAHEAGCHCDRNFFCYIRFLRLVVCAVCKQIGGNWGRVRRHCQR